MNVKIQFVPLFHFNQGYIHFHYDRLLEKKYLHDIIEEETDKRW